MASEDDILARSMLSSKSYGGGSDIAPAPVSKVDVSDLRSRYDGLRGYDSREEYRGFKVPDGMSSDQREAWFASIDEREDAKDAGRVWGDPEPWESQVPRYIWDTAMELEREEKRFKEDPLGRGRAYADKAVQTHASVGKNIRDLSLAGYQGLDALAEDILRYPVKYAQDPLGEGAKIEQAALKLAKGVASGDPESIRNAADIASLRDPSGVSDLTSAAASARLAYEEPEKLKSHLTDVGISSLAGAIGFIPLVGTILPGSQAMKTAIKGAPEVSEASKTVAEPVFESAAEKLAVGLPDKLGVQALEGILGRKKHQKAGQVVRYTQDVKDKDTGKIVHKKGDKKLTKSGEEIVYPDYVYKDITAGEWSDTKLDEFIETARSSGKKSVTKDELIKHLDENKVQVGEVRLGGTPPELKRLQKDIDSTYEPVEDMVREFRQKLDDEGFIVEGTLHHMVKDSPDKIFGAFERNANAIARQSKMAAIRAGSKDLSATAKEVLNLLESGGKSDLFRNPMGHNRKQRIADIDEALRVADSIISDARASGVKPSDVDQRFYTSLKGSDFRNTYNRMKRGASAAEELKNTDAFMDFESAKGNFDLKAREIDVQSPRWEEYSVPGGEDYQEILLTVPVPDSSKRAVAVLKYEETLERARDADQRLNVSVLRGRDDLTPLEQELVDAYIEQERLSGSAYDAPEVFTESHYSDIPNVMAHIRFKTRIDSRGRKVLFVEEIQSDWHQKGLKRGYKGGSKIPDFIEREIQALESAQKAIDDWKKANPKPPNFERGLEVRQEANSKYDIFQFMDNFDEWKSSLSKEDLDAYEGYRSWTIKAEVGPGRGPDGVFIEGELTQLQNKYNRQLKDVAEAIISETGGQTRASGGELSATFGGPAIPIERIRNHVIEQIERNNVRLVPDAPLKDTKEWTALAIKRIFREAAEQGYDGVAFTRGEDVARIVGGAEEGQKYFYDKLIPSIVKKETKAKQGIANIGVGEKFDVDGELMQRSIEVPFFELTDKVKDRVIKPQKLYSLALPGIAVGAAAAEEEELSAVAALGAIGLGGMALYKGAKGARAAGRATDAATAKGESYFDPDKLSQIKKQVQGFGERESLIYMSPDEFLSLAKPLSKPTANKAERVAGMLERGEKFSDIPFLDMKESGKIRGHEGRHRALALKKLGVKKMPVRLMSDDVRWNEQVPGGDDDWYYVENLPKQLIGQDGKTKIKSPFHTEGPNRGKPLPEYSADVPKPAAAPDAATAGAKTVDEAEEAARLWREKGVESPYFKRWFGDSKVVDEAGEALPVFHGTSGDFDEFRAGSTESAFGSAIYTSSSVDDVNANYARREGPDIKNRVEQAADRIEGLYEVSDQEVLDAAKRYLDEIERYGIATDFNKKALPPLRKTIEEQDVSYILDSHQPLQNALIRQIARTRVLGDENFSVMKTYVNIENPVYLDPSGTKGRTTFDLEYKYDEDGDIIDESGSVIDLLEAIDDVSYDFYESPDEVQKLKTFIGENSVDGELDALDLFEEVRGGEYYFESDTGGLENTEFIRQVFERMGFDGIIADAYHFFGDRKGIMGTRIPSMAGVTPGSYHYMAFKPEQIKSATGNVGTFDPSGNILKGIGVGAAVPAAAAVRSQRGEEEGNPIPEPEDSLTFTADKYEYEPMEREDGYSLPIDFSETAQIVDKYSKLHAEADSLSTELSLIEAEYASLSDEDKEGRRGQLLNEWYESSIDKYAAVGEQIDESAYDRFLMGPDVYQETNYSGIQKYDDMRPFVSVGFSGSTMPLDVDSRVMQEDEQRASLKRTFDSGGPMIDLFGKSGSLNRYLLQKAKYFDHPVQTVQLNDHQKRVLASDYHNLEGLKKSGLISYLLYRELLGNVRLP